MTSKPDVDEELNLSANQGGKSRAERLRKYLARYVEKWRPLPSELALVCAAVDGEDEEWMTEVVERVNASLKKGVEDAVETFLKGELETTDLQANLDQVDEAEEKVKDQNLEGEAWRPTRVVHDDVSAYRIAEKQKHLLALQRELSAREDVVDETLERARQLQDRIVKLRKEAEAEMTKTEGQIDSMIDSLAD